MVLLSLIGNIIGNIFGSDLGFEDDTITPCFQPGVLLDSGIYWVQVLRRFLIAGVAVGNSDKMVSSKCDQVCRASELPIYIYEQSTGKKDVDLSPPKPGVLLSAVGAVRKGLWSVLDSVRGHRQTAEDCLREGSTRASSMVKYLSEESDDTTRMGAVGVGALTGYLMGLRGGFFKRLVYSSTAAVAMCALCYPKETYEYSQIGLAHSKKYAKITYNFIYGVNGKKEGEEFQFPQLPQIPTTMNEAWEAVGNLGKSASSMIMGKKEEVQSTEVHVTKQDSQDLTDQPCQCPSGSCSGQQESQNPSYDPSCTK